MRISAGRVLAALSVLGIAVLASGAGAQTPTPLPGGTPPVSGTPPLPAKPPLPPVGGASPEPGPSPVPGTSPAPPGAPGGGGLFGKMSENTFGYRSRYFLLSLSASGWEIGELLRGVVQGELVMLLQYNA